VILSDAGYSPRRTQTVQKSGKKDKHQITPVFSGSFFILSGSMHHFLPGNKLMLQICPAGSCTD